MTRVIDVQIKDKIDNSVLKKIQDIAKAAREAQNSINLMQKAVTSAGGTKAAKTRIQSEAALKQKAINDEKKQLERLEKDRNRIASAGFSQQLKLIKAEEAARTKAAADEKRQLEQLASQRNKLANSGKNLSFKIESQFGGLGKFEKAVKQVNKALEEGQIELAEYNRLVELINKDAENSRLKAEAVEAKKLESSLDSLTRKYAPLQAEINALKADQLSLNNLLQRGVITQQQYDQQITEVSRQLAVVTAEQNKYNEAVKNGNVGLTSASRSFRQNRQNLANLSFQLQDIGVSLAGGQSPFLVLIQQGSQIAQIYGSENGLRGVFRGLAGDIAELAGRFKGPLVAVAAVTATIAGLRSEINRTEKQQLSFAAVAVGAFRTIKDAIVDSLGDYGPLISNLYKDIVSFIGDTATVLFNFIVKGLKVAINSVVTLINFLKEGLNQFKFGVTTLATVVPAGFEKIIKNNIALIDKLRGKGETDTATFFGKVGAEAINRFRDASLSADKVISDFQNNLDKTLDSDPFDELVINAKNYQSEIEEADKQTNQLQKSLEDMARASRANFEQLGMNEYQKAIADIDNQVAGLVAQYGALNSQQLALVESAKKYAVLAVDFNRNKEVQDLAKQTKDAFDTVGLDEYQLAVKAIDDQVAELIERYGSLNKAEQKNIEEIRKQAEQTVIRQKIKQIVEETLTPAEKLNKELAEIDRLRPGAETVEEFEALQRKTEELLDSIDGSAQIFKDFATDIGNRVTDVFQNILSGGRLTFRSLADDIFSIFTRLLARMATLALAKPVILPIIQSVGGAFGASQGTIKATAQQFGITDIGNLGSFTSLGSSLSKPIFTAGSGVAKVIDSVGRSIGLTGKAIPSALQPGLLNPGAGQGLSSAFTGGAAIAGLGGNLLANLLFGGNRGIGSTIGGTAGSIAGTAIGAQIGGTILGIGAGPIGALIGGFAGNALGGLFGGKKPSDKTQVGTIDLSTGLFTNRRGLQGKKFSQENFDSVTQLGQLFAQIGKALGSTDQLSLIVGNRDGLRFQRGGGAVQRFDDPATFIKEITRQLNLGAPTISKSLLTAIDRIDFSQVKDNIEAVLADIDFALAFDKLDFVPKEISAIVQEFNNLNAIFDEVQATTRRLGLEEEKVIQKRKEAIKQLVDNFNASNRDALFSAVLPFYQQISELEKARVQALKDAADIGADVGLVQLRYQAELEAILVQNFNLQTGALEKEQERLQVANDLANRYSRIVDTFDNLLFELNVGQFTSKDPITRIDEFRNIIRDLGSRAQMNDLDAQERLAEILPDFLRISEETYGASVEYGKDLELATKYASETRTAAQRQIDIQLQIANSAQQQVALLEKLTTVRGVTDPQFMTGSFDRNSFARGNPNEILARAVAAGAINSSTADNLARAAGFYGTFGEGRASAFFASNSSAADLLFRALQSAGIAGYAAGGVISGGIPNRDSVPIMAMPGEYVIRASSARNVGNDALNYINNNGSLPASNDNEKLLAAVERQTAVIAKMGDKLIALETQVANNTSNSARGLSAWL